VTISEALVNVVEDKTTVWAENRTPHEYLIPQGQVLGWLNEKEEVEDWIMGDYRPPDLQKGLTTSQVEGEVIGNPIVACQDSDVHAGFTRTHEETLEKDPEVRSGPSKKGCRAWREQTGHMIKEQNTKFRKNLKPDADPVSGTPHMSQYSASQCRGVVPEMPHGRVTSRSKFGVTPYTPTKGEDQIVKPNVGNKHSEEVFQTLRVLDEEGHVVRDFDVNPINDIQIKMGTSASEVHLVCEATEQPHLADDCDSDVEMPGPKTSKSLKNSSKKQVNEEEKLRKHMNVTLSEASNLMNERKSRDIYLE
jgi:hypothetical protein